MDIRAEFHQRMLNAARTWRAEMLSAGAISDSVLPREAITVADTDTGVQVSIFSTAPAKSKGKSSKVEPVDTEDSVVS